MAPTIETARLRLRGPSKDDFAASAALWADANVTRYIMGKPLTDEEVWARLLRWEGHWQWMGFGFWMVEEKATGRFIGEMGFANFHREIEPPLGDTPELGYVLAADAHGRGYATEAVSAMVGWGDKHFTEARTVCLINPDNRASRRVAEKCGYREIQTSSYKGAATTVLERIRL